MLVALPAKLWRTLRDHQQGRVPTREVRKALLPVVGPAIMYLLPSEVREVCDQTVSTLSNAVGLAPEEIDEQCQRLIDHVDSVADQIKRAQKAPLN